MFKWGVIGTGNIANTVCREIVAGGRHIVAAVYSRTLSKAQKFAEKFGAKKPVYNKGMVEKFEIPSPATACPEPEDCKILEELYLYGLHIEQYRHATSLAEKIQARGKSL